MNRFELLFCLVFLINAVFYNHCRAYDPPDFDQALIETDALQLTENTLIELIEALNSVACNFPDNALVDSDLCERALALSLSLAPLNVNARNAHRSLLQEQAPPKTEFFNKSVSSISEHLWSRANKLSELTNEKESKRLAFYLREISLLLHPAPPKARINQYRRELKGNSQSWSPMVKLQPDQNPSSRKLDLLDGNTSTTQKTPDSNSIFVIPSRSGSASASSSFTKSTKKDDKPASSSSDLPEAAKQAQADYRQSIEKASGPLDRVFQRYGERLTDMRAKLQNEGEDAQLAPFQKEIEELQSGVHPAQLQINNLPPALVVARRKFLNSAIDSDSAMALKVTEINQTYRDKLNRIRKSLVSEGDNVGASHITREFRSIPNRAVPDFFLRHAQRFSSSTEVALADLSVCALKCSYEGQVQTTLTNKSGAAIKVWLARGQSLKIRYGCGKPSATMRLLVNGTQKGVIEFQNTGGWEEYADLDYPVTIPDGAKVELIREEDAVDLVSIESIATKPPKAVVVAKDDRAYTFTDFITRYPKAAWFGRSPYTVTKDLKVSFVGQQFKWDSVLYWSGDYTETINRDGTSMLEVLHKKQNKSYKIIFQHDFQVCFIKAKNGKGKIATLQLAPLQ